MDSGTGTGFQLLFWVPYSDYYLVDFLRLCYAYTINAMPPDSYKILGYLGKEFKATFFESLELRPAALMSDFPLCVWRCAVGEDEGGAWGTRVYGVESLEEPQLGSGVAAGALAEDPESLGWGERDSKAGAGCKTDCNWDMGSEIATLTPTTRQGTWSIGSDGTSWPLN